MRYPNNVRIYPFESYRFYWYNLRVAPPIVRGIEPFRFRVYFHARYISMLLDS